MLFRWAIYYTVCMYSRIERQMRLQRWLNQSVRGLLVGGGLVMVALLIFRRVVGVETAWLLGVLPIVPVVTAVLALTWSIHPKDVLRYAEQSSGDTGLLWFDHSVDSKEWREKVDAVWSTVRPPTLQIPELSAVALFSCVLSVAMLWMPLRTVRSDNHYPTIVEQELTQVKQQIDSIEALLEPDTVDPEVEAWKDSLDQIEDGMSVGSTLRELDQLSEQIEQRQQSALESVEDAMEALQQGDQDALQTATEQLQAQNMLPKSADGTQSGKDSKEGNKSNQGTNPEGQKTEASKQNGQSSTASQSQQQLQQQLKKLQQQLQQVQNQSNQPSSNSGQQGSSQNGTTSQGTQGIQSFSNEALQQMSQQSQSSNGEEGNAGQSGQQSDQSGQNGQGEGQSGQSQSGQSQSGQGQQSGEGQNGQGEGQSGEGGSQSMDSSNASSSGGGDTAPLTYEEGSLVPNQNLRALDGIPQVDWDNSVQFSTVPTPFGEVQTVPTSTSGNVQPTTSSVAGQSQIAPQHRQVVEDFFAVEQE